MDDQTVYLRCEAEDLLSELERLSFEISNGLREVPKGLVDLIHAGGEAGLVDIDVFAAPFTNELIVRFKPSERLRVLNLAAGTSDVESVAI
jgi:hypothetical protein